jgi:hypothetical protein
MALPQAGGEGADMALPQAGGDEDALQPAEDAGFENTTLLEAAAEAGINIGAIRWRDNAGPEARFVMVNGEWRVSLEILERHANSDNDGMLHREASFLEGLGLLFADEEVETRMEGVRLAVRTTQHNCDTFATDSARQAVVQIGNGPPGNWRRAG